ncbi:hypothetical protein M758_2G113000 [Ceratodon purpureus]|nr:hypothetical protein M758_2G113000 [Ceratodon purpureus]
MCFASFHRGLMVSIPCVCVPALVLKLQDTILLISEFISVVDPLNPTNISSLITPSKSTGTSMIALAGFEISCNVDPFVKKTATVFVTPSYSTHDVNSWTMFDR